MAITPVYLRSVPSDAAPNDVRLYDPTTLGANDTTLGANSAVSAVGVVDLATGAGNDTTLGATSTATAVGSATISTGIQLSAAPSATATATATLSTSIRLEATPAGTAATTGVLTTGINLSASAAGSATSTASAATAIQLAAAANAAATGLADLQTGAGSDTTLSASAFASATSLADLSGGLEPVVYTPPASLGGGDVAFFGGHVFLRDEAPATKPEPTKRPSKAGVSIEPDEALVGREDPRKAETLLELEAANVAAAKAVADVIRVAAQDARQAQLAREQKRREDNNRLAIWLALLDEDD